MSRKILAATGATVLGALTVLGIATASAGTAHASTKAVATNAVVVDVTAESAPDCEDGFTLLLYYTLIGDTATANALAENLAAMGCMI
jgi:hypothetical protein